MESGEVYPPALALARAELSNCPAGRFATPEAFMQYYGDALRRHLRQQPHAGFVLAEAVRDEVGYLARGRFYWILGVQSAAQVVQWVSDDYFVYENPAADFDLHRLRLPGSDRV